MSMFHNPFKGAYNNRAICPRTGESECYSTFAEYLDPIIRDYHAVKDPDFKHPAAEFGDLENLPFGDLDPTSKICLLTSSTTPS